MAARSGMQAVELYEEPEPSLGRAGGAGGADGRSGRGGDGAAADGPSAGRARTPGSGVRLRWWLVGAVAAVGLVVAQSVISAHERARDARIAAIPGVVARTDTTLAPVWRMTDDERRFVTSAVRIGDGAIGVMTAPDGSRAVQALDVATGRLTWSYPLNGPDALRSEAGDDVVQPGSCTAVPDTQPDTRPAAQPGRQPDARPAATGVTRHVACYLTDGVGVRTGGGLVLALRVATAGRVVVLDAAGTVLVDRSTAVAPTFGVAGSLLVLGSAASNGRRVLHAQDLLTGAPRWTWRQDDAVGAVGSGRLGFQVFGLGDAVGVALPAGQVVVLGADGSVVHPLVGDVWSWRVDGSTAVLGVSGGATRLVRVGAADVVLRGSPSRTVVDDGSLPGIVLTADGRALRASDAQTGTTRWVARIGPQSGVVVLHGRVAVLGSGALVVLDGVSGVTQAVVPPQAGATLTSPMSDGRHVLVAELGLLDGTATLAAFDAGGRRAWTTPLPFGTTVVQQAGRQVLVYDEVGLEVLGTRE